MPDRLDAPPSAILIAIIAAALICAAGLSKTSTPPRDASTAGPRIAKAVAGLLHRVELVHPAHTPLTWVSASRYYAVAADSTVCALTPVAYALLRDARPPGTPTPLTCGWAPLTTTATVTGE